MGRRNLWELFLGVFSVQAKYILKIILIFMVYKTKSLLYGSKNL